MSIAHIISELQTFFKNKEIKVCELGVFKGDGIEKIITNLNVEKYFGIDIFSDSGIKDEWSSSDEIYNSLLNKYKYDKRIHFIKDKTANAVKLFDDNYFDLIFIDAEHSYNAVKQDIELWYPKMKKNGIFSGDDFFYPPVQKAVYEFQEKHNLQLYNSITCNEYAHRNINGRMEDEHSVLEYIGDKEKYKRNFTWYFKT